MLNLDHALIPAYNMLLLLTWKSGHVCGKRLRACQPPISARSDWRLTSALVVGEQTVTTPPHRYGANRRRL